MSNFCDAIASTSDSALGSIPSQAFQRNYGHAITGSGLRGLRRCPRSRRSDVRPHRAEVWPLAQGRPITLDVRVNAEPPERYSQGDARKRAEDRWELLLKYVRDVKPQAVQDFLETAEPEVAHAIEHTVGSMLGSLPLQFFDVRISTGEVVRWHHETGAESMSAVQYMEQLEDELKMLRSQLQEKQTETQNDLLEYIKSLEPEELTKDIGDEVFLAMSVFMRRLMGATEGTELQPTSCNIELIDIARLLYWLIVVGYTLRESEVRFDMNMDFD